MAQQWLGLDEFKRKAAAGQPVQGIAVRKALSADGMTVEPGDTRRVKFTISTGQIDRDRDFVSPKGWNLDNYRKTPVVLWAHDYSSLPIGKAVEIGLQGDKLVATAEFTPAEMNPMGETVYQMLKHGFLGASSVGFKPVEFQYNTERKGVDFSRQELLEFSVVPIPSNPGALAETRSAQIDLAPLADWVGKTAAMLTAAHVGHLTYAPTVAPEVVGKRGRVISAANEAKLRAAIESLAAGKERLDSVLALLDVGPEPGAETTPPPEPPGKAAADAVTKGADDEMVLDLDDDPNAVEVDEDALVALLDAALAKATKAA